MQIDGALAGESYCYITTVGRVTGKPHTVEIWFALVGSTLYVLAGSGHGADFVKNAKRQAHVSIRIAGTQFSALTRVAVTDDEERAARTLVYDKYAPNYNDLEDWRETALVVAFDLEAVMGAVV